MNQAIQEFVGCRSIAVIGASRGGKKFGNAAAKELQTRGYQVFIIHPEAQDIDGQTCYPNLSALRGQIDAVLISVPAAQAAAVMREAASLDIRHVWLQQGAESPELLALGQDLGLSLVSKKCVLMYAPPVKSFHGWHRGFVKLVGKL
jgi:predicted CoA-binding protein